MRFNDGDELLSIGVVVPGRFVLVATDGGYAKRTPIEEYPLQGRGGKGVLTIQHDSKRGRLVGALIVDEDDELYAIESTGVVIRTSAREVRRAGRQTKGVRLMNLAEGTTLVAVARNAEDVSDVSNGTAEATGGTSPAAADVASVPEAPGNDMPEAPDGDVLEAPGDDAPEAPGNADGGSDVSETEA
jgi:DNA gyrase subunit A